MDFILFYSKYSNKCSLLFQEIPLLNDKAVCIDSGESRNFLHNLPYEVKRVPTLFVTDGIDKIIKVLEGIQEIRNWFLLLTYSMSAQPTEEGNEEVEEPPEPDDLLPPPENGISISEASGMNNGTNDYILKTAKVGGLKNVAEELARERELFLESTAPQKPGTSNITRI